MRFSVPKSFEVVTAEKPEEKSVELVDVFFEAQGRVIRVSIPETFLALTCWVLDPARQDNIEYIDEQARSAVTAGSVGYAQALVKVLKSIENDPISGTDFYLARQSDEVWLPLQRRFADDQAMTERLWRVANNDWRDPLPPALD